MKPFSRSWWGKFTRETDNLRKILLVKGILKDEIDQLHTFSDKVFLTSFKEPDDMIFRLWINGERVFKETDWGGFLMKKEYKTIDEILASNPGILDFGIIQNYCETLDEDFKLYVFEMFYHLFQTQGIPTHGNEVTLFAGNYSKTPIGFHLDQPGHRVIHLQIGPGVKEMYLIPKSIYENELSFMTEGKPNFFEIEQLIPFATKYIIEAGDLFYMPHGYYHVGRNIGFSKSVTIWLEDLTEEKLIDRLVLYLSSQIFKSEGNNVIPSDRSSIASTSFLYSRIKHLIRNDEGVLKLSVKDLIQRCLKEYKYLIASNNSYVPRPLRESGNSTSKVEWTEIVQVNSKYKLLVSTNQKVLKVFWMGTSFSLPNSYSVRKIVRLIQKGGSIKTQDLIATLHKDFDSESSLEIINVLVKKKILLSR